MPIKNKKPELVALAAALDDKKAVQIINANPVLLSHLYDCDLLPEQLAEGSPEWNEMKYFVVVYQEFKALQDALKNKAV